MGRRSLLSDAHADAIISSMLDVRWVARLEGLASNMTQRVPFPQQNLPAPSVTAFDSDDCGDEAFPEASVINELNIPGASGSVPGTTTTTTTREAAGPIDMTAQATTTTTQSQGGKEATSLSTTTAAERFSKVSDVFTAKERVPLASAWGIEDCSATLSSAFGALAQTLQERPADADSAVRLYERNKTLLELVCYHCSPWLFISPSVDAYSSVRLL